MNPQRDISFSCWQQDDENFSLRVDPLQFCSGLLYIYYKLWGIVWLNESKISPCQRDDENFFWEYTPFPDWISENIYLYPWRKKLTARRGNLIYSPKIFWVPWIRSPCQRDDENFYWGYTPFLDWISENICLYPGIKKIVSKKRKSHSQPLIFLSPLNQLVCLLALWGLGSTLPPMVLAGRPTDSWDLKSSTEGSLKML